MKTIFEGRNDRRKVVCYETEPARPAASRRRVWPFWVAILGALTLLVLGLTQLFGA